MVADPSFKGQYPAPFEATEPRSCAFRAGMGAWLVRANFRTATPGKFAVLLLTPLDLVALCWFLGTWIAYSAALSLTERRRRGLNSEMNLYRDIWMLQMLKRETRMVDAQIVAALQNGTAFFASTSLIAVGGTLTLLRSPDEILQVVGSLPLGMQMTRVQWEA